MQKVDSVIRAKVVVLGNTGVGKTCLVTSYVTGNFPQGVAPTIGAAYLSKDIDVGRSRVKLQIWDTAGQERFRSMAPIYYRGADAAILVFDVKESESLDAVTMWIKELRSAQGVPENIAIMIAANKVDEETEVDPKTCSIEIVRQAAKLAEKESAMLLCTSGITKIGLDKLFVGIAKDLLANQKTTSPQENIQLNKQQQKPATSGCC